METILWQLLIDQGCSIEKYLQKIKYKDSETGDEVVFFVTKIMTLSSKRGLFITRVIEGNWYDTIKKVDVIFEAAVEKLELDTSGYMIFFHGYFDSIKLEQFYIINPGSEDRLNKLPLTALEKLLR